MFMLVICAGISWAGCGNASAARFPDEASCHRALQTMVVQQNGQAATNGNGRQMLAYCRPAMERDPR